VCARSVPAGPVQFSSLAKSTLFLEIASEHCKSTLSTYADTCILSYSFAVFDCPLEN